MNKCKNAMLFMTLCLLLTSCSNKGEENSYIFEAENAYLYTCKEVDSPNIEKEISNNKSVGYIQKGSEISFGLETNEEILNQKFTLRISHPLQWKDDAPYPVDFIFSDIYFVTINDQEVSFDKEVIKVPDTENKAYNYYAMVDVAFECNLKKGQNIISFNCIASSNNQVSTYSSIGNIDYLSCESSKIIKEFKPDIQHNSSSSCSLELTKKNYLEGEDIIVKFVDREDHPRDRIALFDYEAILGKDNPIFSFYPSEESEKSINIIGKNSDIKILPKGKYKICYLADDGFNALISKNLSVIGKDDISYMSIEKDFFKVNEKIFIKSKQREGHSTDWIALYRYNDTVGKIGSLYYYYPEVIESVINIIGQNPNSERSVELTKGRYKLCYLADNGYEILQEIEIEIVE